MAVAASVNPSSGASPPTSHDLERLQNRLSAHIDDLAHEGIYVQETALSARPCVSVAIVNPTRPNLNYLRGRFGPHLCFERRDAGQAACAPFRSVSDNQATVQVPDLRGLGLYEAERHAVAQGLTYTFDCLGHTNAQPRKPSRFSPEALVRVTAQCPAPGETVQRGTSVALEARATLPGDFPYAVSALHQEGSASDPCGEHHAP